MLQETTTVLSVIHRAHLTALSATVQETTTVLSEHLRVLQAALSATVPAVLTVLSATQTEADLSAVTV